MPPALYRFGKFTPLVELHKRMKNMTLMTTVTNNDCIDVSESLLELA